MKTKEQVLKHLNSVGYTRKAISQICGFLVGVELIEIGSKIPYVKGEHSFSDFYSWYMYDEKDTLTQILDSIVDKFNEAKEDKDKMKFANWFKFLCNEFDIDLDFGIDLENRE